MIMRAWQLWLVVLALCAVSPLSHPQEIRGRVVFSVEVVEWALERNADGSRSPKQRTGIFSYCSDDKPPACGQTLTGYKLRDGKIVEISGLGSFETDVFLKKLNALTLSSFDVQKEIDATLAAQRAESQKTGKPFPVVMTLDGARYRIRYDFNGVSIDHTAWNPGTQISHLAPYSGKLGGLNALIDLFATSYGRRQFGL